MDEQIIIWLGIGALAILAIRFFGAWMLRINDVIDELKEINKQLKNK